MKKLIVLSLIIIFELSLIACSKKQITTKEDVIKFVEEKGKDNITVEDFKHLDRLTEEEKFYNSEKYIFKLDNNCKLYLSVIDDSGKPTYMGINDGKNKTILK
ncbi:hypothetical protein ACWOAQ_07870 [Helcococcus kunzii]|uniref:Uncharacterized protein n=1 Tax=Helcococcus kunzii ATCC 51366 TaxID=883114 RepID=H3NMG6_9FIRM|nr:hypothetical protein [Helcococcus kunzii]EHR35000.1 hypothetical protein HMPREF9709_00527 [Helcococcus kunzii ATCC 51366]MCT1796782.1 hypothetical protein [Helcococcus kunzii]MCT1988628.1 hypothetical protein [Helcococcus kunzii]QUY64478.1 hypothetical protein GUI37_02740 [Helcococcus kunzii]QZO76888.1 hypothetical protein HIF96_02400 [Helcococcus kunzii]